MVGFVIIDVHQELDLRRTRLDAIYISYFWFHGLQNFSDYRGGIDAIGFSVE